MERTILTERELRRRAARRREAETVGRLSTGAPAPASPGVTSPGEASPGEASPGTDNWQTQLLKMLPAEVISAYITLNGLLKGSVLPTTFPRWYVGLLWGIFGVLAVLNPLYLRYVSKVTNRRQLWLSAGAFVIYVVGLGGPFLHLGIAPEIVHLIGAVLIPIYTLTALILINR